MFMYEGVPYARWLCIFPYISKKTTVKQTRTENKTKTNKTFCFYLKNNENPSHYFVWLGLGTESKIWKQSELLLGELLIREHFAGEVICFVLFLLNLLKNLLISKQTCYDYFYQKKKVTVFDLQFLFSVPNDRKGPQVKKLNLFFFLSFFTLSFIICLFILDNKICINWCQCTLCCPFFLLRNNITDETIYYK